MKFVLNTTGFFYTYKKDMERLTKYGFYFEPFKYGKFIIKGHPIIEITTLEDLLKLAAECESDIILRIDGPQITIYDDYI